MTQSLVSVEHAKNQAKFSICALKYVNFTQNYTTISIEKYST